MNVMTFQFSRLALLTSKARDKLTREPDKSLTQSPIKHDRMDQHSKTLRPHKKADLQTRPNRLPGEAPRRRQIHSLLWFTSHIRFRIQISRPRGCFWATYGLVIQSFTIVAMNRPAEILSSMHTLITVLASCNEVLSSFHSTPPITFSRKLWI